VLVASQPRLLFSSHVHLTLLLKHSIAYFDLLAGDVYEVSGYDKKLLNNQYIERLPRAAAVTIHPTSYVYGMQQCLLSLARYLSVSFSLPRALFQRRPLPITTLPIILQAPIAQHWKGYRV
jgi:hypothetical protein